MHIGSFHLRAFFFVSCVSRRESVVFPGRVLILFGFSDLPRAPAPLCDHGLLMFDKTQGEATTRTYSGVILGHGVDHGPTDKWKAGLFFFCPRYGRYHDPKKSKAPITCVKKQKTQIKCPGFRLSAHIMRFKYFVVKIPTKISQNGAGHFLSKTFDLNMGSSFGNIS